jgi:hypothetical protein
METMPAVTFNLAGENLTVLNELLAAEQARLLVEIRHTDHRSYREELRRRLAIVEHLIDTCRTA